MTDTSFDSLPEATLIRVNELCNRFEGCWQTEQQQSIESLLEDVDAEHRSLLAAELIGLEVEFRARRGETVTAEEYMRRFPFVGEPLIHDAMRCKVSGGNEEVPEHNESLSSQQVGEYSIQERIGSGGMGTVYKAVHRRMQRVVAIKLLRWEYAHDPRFRERFSREVRAAAKLSHPNIVAAYDAGKFRGTPYLVSEYVDAQDLSQVIRESGPLPVAQAVNVVTQAAHGLQYIHDQGIIHRDIKPANLLLDESGCVKILDVGLSRLRRPDGEASADFGCVALSKDRLADGGIPNSELSVAGVMMGTITCMSPEQAQDSRDADERSDIYSLGCTLYFLLSGRHCYDGRTSSDQILAHRSHPVPSLESPVAVVPEWLNDVFRRMVAKLPADRYGSTVDLIADLTAGHAGVDDLRADDSKTWEVERLSANDSPRKRYETVPPRLTRRQFFTFLTTGFAAFLLLAGSTWYILEGRVPPADSQVPDTPPPVRPTDLGTDTDTERETPRAVAPFDETTARELQQTWAEHLGVQSQIHDESTGVDFVLIPAGEFTMGSSADEVAALTAEFMLSLNSEYESELLLSEAPQRHVTISRPFYVSRTEVTLEQFLRFVNETGYVTDAERNDLGWGLRDGEWRRRESDFFSWKDVGEATERLTDLHAVGNLSWNDAVAYCRWCSHDGVVCRLPTEAEWEYACRAGTETRFSWGDHTVAMHEFANIREDGDFNGRAFPDPVGLRRPNAFGLFDMHGNQAEFCRDWYADDAYQNESAVTDPVGPTSRQRKPGGIEMGRVVRGGRAGSVPVTARSAARNGSPEDSPVGGIRLVREIP